MNDDGSHSSELQDTPAEVDAAFRTLRRVALTYFLVFLAAVAAFPILSMTLPWWSEARLLGNLSPGFLTTAVGLYVVFAVIGIAAASLSSSVEARMLGGSADGTSAGDLSSGEGDAGLWPGMDAGSWPGVEPETWRGGEPGHGSSGETRPWSGEEAER